MASRAFFNGRLLTSPTVAGKVDDSAMAPVTLQTGNFLAILGTATRGQPKTLLSFDNPSQALRTLGDCELAEAVRKSFAPSSSTGSPGRIYAMRVGQPTQAALTLKDGTGNDVIALTSADYGVIANQVKVKVEAATNAGRKLTTQLGSDYYTQDDVAADAFTIQYAGTGTGTMAVANTAVTLVLNSVTTTITLASFPTVAQLVDRLNAVAGITASYAARAANRATVSGLDTLTATDIKTAPVVATANLAAAVEWFNGVAENFISATRVAGAGAVPAVLGFTYLAGGTDPAVINQDWQDALTALQTAEVQHVVALTSAAAVHAMVDAHGQYMSAVAGKRRRGYSGPAIGTTLVTAKTLPKALDSDRFSLCFPGYYDYDATGTLVLRPSYMTAALVAAGFAALPPGEPMTNKTLAVRGLELDLRNPGDTDDAIQAGLLCVENTPTGYRVVRSITTWLENDNFNRVENSTGLATDYMMQDVTDALRVLKGGAASPQTLQRGLSIIDSRLRAMAKPQPEGPGILVGDAASPAFLGLTGTIVGDQLSYTWQASPVIPANFILCTASIRPYSGTASAVAA